MLQYTKKLNPAVFVPTFFLVILEIAKTFSSILLPQYFIDDITNRSSIRQTMFHLAILIIAIFGIQIFRAAITPYILKAYNRGDANTALDYAFHYVKMEYKDQENDEIRNTQEKLRRNVTANGFVADDLSGFFINLFLVIGFSFIMVRLHVLIYLVFFVIAICNTYLENVTSSNKSLLAQTSSQKEGSYDIEFVDVSFKKPCLLSPQPYRYQVYPNNFRTPFLI